MADFSGTGTVHVKRAWVSAGDTMTRLPEGKVTGRITFDGPWVHVETKEEGIMLSFPTRVVIQVAWHRTE